VTAAGVAGERGIAQPEVLAGERGDLQDTLNGETGGLENRSVTLRS